MLAANVSWFIDYKPTLLPFIYEIYVHILYVIYISIVIYSSFHCFVIFVLNTELELIHAFLLLCKQNSLCDTYMF